MNKLLISLSLIGVLVANVASGQMLSYNSTNLPVTASPAEIMRVIRDVVDDVNGNAFDIDANNTISGNNTLTGNNTLSGTNVISGPLTISGSTTLSGNQVSSGNQGDLIVAQNVTNLGTILVTGNVTYVSLTDEAATGVVTIANPPIAGLRYTIINGNTNKFTIAATTNWAGIGAVTFSNSTTLAILGRTTTNWLLLDRNNY